MSERLLQAVAPVRGTVDAAGRLVAADPQLAELHARAGGEEGGMLAVPQIAALARLAKRLGIIISRPVIAGDVSADLDLWVRAQPSDGGVDLAITGWHRRPASGPPAVPDRERESDFARAAADWGWETDEGLHLTSVDPNAVAGAAKAPSDFVGKPLTRLFRLIEGGDGSLPILSALAEQHAFDSQAAELRGSKQRYMLRGVPLIDGAGRFAGFRGWATSVPEQASEDVLRPDAPRKPDSGAFGERLGMALKRPLDEIIAQAEAMSAEPDGPLPQDYAGYARDIASAGRHLLALVDDLVDLQAIERPDFTPDQEEIDLADLARRTAGLLSVRAGMRNVRLEAPAPNETFAARGEFKRVLQILMNLVSNAIRYSPEGGVVRLTGSREGQITCIAVADEGKGVAEEDQARIFEKFERLDPSEPGGTGLGLYIARRLARAMGGDIAVESASGKGARFILRLPSQG